MEKRGVPTLDSMVFKEMGEATNMKQRNNEMSETEIDLVLSTAPTVNNQAQMKQKTVKEKYTQHLNPSCPFALQT